MPQLIEDWLPVATLIAALLGPAVAFFIGRHTVRASLENVQKQIDTSLNVARLQVQASVVSSNRQKWIDALRDELAEFISELDILAARKADADPDKAAIRMSSSRLVRLFHQLQLRLNPKETDHIRIVKLADDFTRPPSEMQRDEALAELIDLSQVVLKREWDRVKAGE